MSDDEGELLSNLLELVPYPAYFVNVGHDEVVPANALGTTHCARDRERALAIARDPQVEELCTALPTGGQAGSSCFLIVCRQRPDEVTTPLERAALSWKLTQKQAEVLGFVVVGLTNKEIAEKLRYAESTVEAHITRLLAKTGATQRGALIFRFWSRFASTE